MGQLLSLPWLGGRSSSPFHFLLDSECFPLIDRGGDPYGWRIQKPTDDSAME